MDERLIQPPQPDPLVEETRDTVPPLTGFAGSVSAPSQG